MSINNQFFGFATAIPQQTNINTSNFFPQLGGGGGQSNQYPFTSSIGADAAITGSSTLTFTYQGTTGSAQNLTDIITFTGNHKYNLSFTFTAGSTGDFLPTDVVTAGTSLAIFGGLWYSPQAYMTGQNTDDKALLTASMTIAPSQTFSTVIYINPISPGNTSTVTTEIGAGLADGYKILLTDFGPRSS